MLLHCPVFRWGTAGFLCSSWYSTGFGILDLGFRRTGVQPHWCFSCCWADLTLIREPFSFPCSANEEVHRKLIGSTGGRAALDWPEGYSVPRNVMPSTWTRGDSWECWSLLGNSISQRQWATVLRIACLSWVLFLFLFLLLPLLFCFFFNY